MSNNKTITNKNNNNTQEMLPILVEALVKSAERLEHVTMDTATIIKSLNNGLTTKVDNLATSIKDLITFMKSDVLPKLDLESLAVKLKEKELEVKKAEIEAKKEARLAKYKLLATIGTIVLGSSGLLFSIIKWIVIPVITGGAVPPIP